MTNIGFTGTRKGMTDAQEDAVTLILFEYTIDNVHHGDCVGADAQFHKLVRQLYGADVHIVLHPGMDKRGKSPSRAFCEGDEAMPTLPYLERNKLIVDHTGALIATPEGFHEQRHSGTWSTIRYAVNHSSNRVHVVYPDGSVRTYR